MCSLYYMCVCVCNYYVPTHVCTCVSLYYYYTPVSRSLSATFRSRNEGEANAEILVKESVVENVQFNAM